MRLESISPCIFIDQIITQGSETCVHFITHLDQCLTVAYDWKSRIYTSKYISEMLQIKKICIPKKYLITLDKNEERSIKLPDETTIRVRMFECDGLSGNIMLYFQSKERNVLFCGCSMKFRSIFLNRTFCDLVESGIEKLYVDNTRAHSTTVETLESAAGTILNIINNHPDFQIMLNVPAFGYEDLIHRLVSEYKLKIFAGKLFEKAFEKRNITGIFANKLKTANILVGEQCVTTDDLKRRLAQKRLTVHFIESYDDVVSELKDLGLFLINYTPHPSLFDLHSIISFVEPLEVHGIYENIPPIPKFLSSLCRSKKTKPSKQVQIISNEENYSECPNTNELVSTRVSGIQKRPIELPRNVMSTRKKKCVDELTPRVAIVKPNTTRNDIVANKLDDLEEIFEIREEISQDSSSILDVENDLSSVRFSYISSISEEMSNVPEEIDETLMETLAMSTEDDHFQDNNFNLQEVQSKRSFQQTTNDSHRNTTTGTFIDQKRKANVFARRAPTVQFSSDDSAT